MAHGDKTALVIEFMNAHRALDMDACCKLMAEQMGCIANERVARLWYGDLVRKGRAPGVIVKRPVGRPRSAAGGKYHRPAPPRQIRLVCKAQAAEELGVTCAVLAVLAKKPQFPPPIQFRGRTFYDGEKLEEYKQRQIQHHAKCLEVLTGRLSSPSPESAIMLSMAEAN